MNYHRKQWEKQKKPNPFAKELQDPKFKPKTFLDKRKITPRNYEIEDDYSNTGSRSN